MKLKWGDEEQTGGGEWSPRFYLSFEKRRGGEWDQAVGPRDPTERVFSHGLAEVHYLRRAQAVGPHGT